MKKNDGFTLVELIVVVAIGAIVMAAASTVLLLGLRINKHSAEDASERNQIRAALYVMETTAKQSQIDRVEKDASNGTWKIIAKTDDDVQGEKTLFSYQGKTIYIGTVESGTVLLADIDADVKYGETEEGVQKMLTITVTSDDKSYTSEIYCRTGSTTPTGGSANPQSAEEIPVPTIYNIEARENFLSILASEVGSTGQSLTTGEYFSEWYIGSYEANPGWGPDTPWCACFLSWALEQCGDDLFGVAPRYAHVDRFMDFFPTITTDAAKAQPGDVIFFDMEDDGAAEPTHVGAVVRVEDGYVHTIEGNTAGTVAGRKYALEDSQILGYGVLNWK